MYDFQRSRQSAKATANIVSISVLGRPARRPAENAARLALTAEIIEALIEQSHWHPIAGVLLPAGFFRHGPPFGAEVPAARAELFAALPLGRQLISLLAELHLVSRGVVMVVGVDTNRLARQRYRGDQMMVALSGDRLISVVRKVFPSDLDTSGWWQRPYVVNPQDFGDAGRRIMLPGGMTAEVSVCYDAFAYSEMVLGRSAKRRHLRFGFTETGRVGAIVAEKRDEWMATHLERLKTDVADVSLVGIHGFEHPGRDGYWQRHGLATCSAATEGRPAIGAAHFTSALPTPQSSPLAAARAPLKHLTEGGYRLGHGFRPISSMIVSHQGRPAALLRLFQV